MARLKIDNQTRLMGLIGNPVEHSLSPAMHNPALRKMGLNCIYLPFRVDADKLGDAVAAIRALNLLGVNVTVPYKQSVIEYLDKLSAAAKACGAVNLIKNNHGCLEGLNTDGQGFMASLQEYSVSNIENVVMLGAGGAAYSVAFELVRAGCKNLAVLDLDKRKANCLAEFVSQAGDCIGKGEQADQELFAQFSRNADLIINCTPVGMHPNTCQSPVQSLDWVNTSAVVYDLIYNPVKTCFLSMADERGLKTINGLSMLVHQGALTLKILTGIEPDLRHMKEVAYHSVEKH